MNDNRTSLEVIAPSIEEAVNTFSDVGNTLNMLDMPEWNEAFEYLAANGGKLKLLATTPYISAITNILLQLYMTQHPYHITCGRTPLGLNVL